jgi:hydroxypyruvate isomerase
MRAHFLSALAAAEVGFRAVEAQVPYDWPAVELARRPQDHALDMVLIDTPQGDWSRGERGLAALPGREAEFRSALDQAGEYASILHCPCVRVIAGVVPEGASREAMEETYLGNLAYHPNN